MNYYHLPVYHLTQLNKTMLENCGRKLCNHMLAVRRLKFICAGIR
jgi:hypothetical protein